jgi:formate dehydrogenase maturation protein FdhE
VQVSDSLVRRRAVTDVNFVWSMVRDDEADVVCPYCGAPNVVGLDPGGAAVQTYEEDCQVCCQMWRVHVRFGCSGRAKVSVERADESSYE